MAGRVFELFVDGWSPGWVFFGLGLGLVVFARVGGAAWDERIAVAEVWF